MEALILKVSGFNEFAVIGIAALVVFLFVKALNKLGYLSTGTMKRVGVAVGAVLTSNMMFEAEKALYTVLVGLLAVGFNELARFVGKVRISKA